MTAMPRNNLQRNADYWAQRMKNMEDALLDQSYSYVENLDAQFRAAEAEIERQMSAWYRRFAANNDITLADAKRLLNSDELAEFHWTVEEYIKHGEENALTGAWMKELENASARVHISRLDALKIQLQQQAELLYSNQLDYLDTVTRQAYAGSYYHTAYEIQKGLGVGWTMQAINENTIKKVLSRPWTTDGQTFRDRCWTNKQSLVNSVNTQLTQMIIRGEPPDKAISAIAKQFEVSRSKAGRLVPLLTGTPAPFAPSLTARCSACRTTRWGSPLRRFIRGAGAAPAPIMRTWRALESDGPETRTAPQRKYRPTPPLMSGGRALCRAPHLVCKPRPRVLQLQQRQPRISRMLCKVCRPLPAATRTPWSSIMLRATKRPRPSLSAMSSPALWRTGLSPAASKRSK